MTITSGPTNWVAYFIERNLPTGYPRKFGDLRLEGEFRVLRNGAGPADFATCTIVVERTPIPSLVSENYIFKLPGGRKYRTLPDNQRTPFTYPTITVELLVAGDTDAVMAYQNEVTALQGYVLLLRFSGAESLFDQYYSHFYQKECRAELVSVSGTQEYTMVTPSPSDGPTTVPRTHCVMSLTFDLLSEMERVL